MQILFNFFAWICDDYVNMRVIVYLKIFKKQAFKYSKNKLLRMEEDIEVENIGV